MRDCILIARSHKVARVSFVIRSDHVYVKHQTLSDATAIVVRRESRVGYQESVNYDENIQWKKPFYFQQPCSGSRWLGPNGVHLSTVYTVLVAPCLKSVLLLMNSRCSSSLSLRVRTFGHRVRVR